MYLAARAADARIGDLCYIASRPADSAVVASCPPGLFIGALRRRLLIGARLNAFVNCDLCRIARVPRKDFRAQWRNRGE